MHLLHGGFAEGAKPSAMTPPRFRPYVQVQGDDYEGGGGAGQDLVAGFSLPQNGMDRIDPPVSLTEG